MMEKLSFEAIEERYKKIVLAVEAAKKKANRTDHVEILAATKTVPPEFINDAIKLGITTVGENRVTELVDKFPLFNKSAAVHFIGTLQRNKVKHVVERVSMIHSVSTLALARTIDVRSRGIDKVMDILIEVNVGNEPTKSGVPLSEVGMLIEEVSALKNVRLRGFMAIPPKSDNDVYFSLMGRLFSEYKLKLPDFDILSMGMSNDYELAINYGANIVRIGSGLFGERQTNKENNKEA